MILFIGIILISSVSAISAAEIDENQTDDFAVPADESASEESQEVLSASDSAEPTLGSSNAPLESNAYLVLDNDASKEDVHIGEYFKWILTVENYGPDTAKNVKVHDSLPRGLQYVGHTATKGTFDPATGIWDIGDLTFKDGFAQLFILVKALTSGEKINKAFITTDSNNTNEITFEQEEIDVSDDAKVSGFEKEAQAKMYPTGNPIFLILVAIFALFILVIRR
ncbi:DUF11 domain-containing protein [uncultured Methanobrevibacter sp.]|uniref:DUF11 domain-containing protein n=1 Tax=uncultured Methanobrevibacter sp. TaxID=253161 RepID=UPI0025CD87A6|nr:DUF11 domain-containing protein [uncultured Methanobrevibacter sp.]